MRKFLGFAILFGGVIAQDCYITREEEKYYNSPKFRKEYLLRKEKEEQEKADEIVKYNEALNDVNLMIKKFRKTQEDCTDLEEYYEIESRLKKLNNTYSNINDVLKRLEKKNEYTHPSDR
jgi:uncharacterized protein YlxW (UPF0749 family)